MIAGQSSEPFFPVLWLMLGCSVLAGCLGFVRDVLSARIGQRLIGRLRAELFSKIVNLPVGYIDRHSHGDLMSRMTNDIDNISNTVSMALPTLFSGVLTIAGTVSVMLWFSWQLTLVACTTIVLTAVSVSLLAGPVRRATRVRQELLGALNGKAEETISSYRTVVAYGQQARMGEEFERVSDQLTHSGVKAETLAGILNPVMNAVSNAGLILIVACGAAFALKGMITVGVIAAFLRYAQICKSSWRSFPGQHRGYLALGHRWGSCRPPLRAPSVFLRFLTRQARTARAGIFAWSRARASSSRGSHSAMTRKSQ